MSTRSEGLGRRVYEILEPAGPGDRPSKAYDIFLLIVVGLNVIAVIAHSVAAIAAAYGAFFLAFEVISVALFAAEFLIRLWCCDHSAVLAHRGAVAARLAYMASPTGFVDLLAFMPFFVVQTCPVEPHVAIVLPLLRVLKLVRYSPAVETLGAVLYNERRTLLASATIMLVLLLFSSSLVYLVERNAQPEFFASIPSAMWWGIATLTTVGYGDVTPVTPLGKLFGAIVTVLGVAMFALPAGILATGFAQEIKQREFLVTWNLVASVPVFSSLQAAEIAHIARLLVPQVAQPGQLVLRRGAKADCMFFVVSGELEVDLGETRIPLEGDFFGEIALLTSGTRSATVRAVTRVQLLLLHAQHFQTFLQNNPEIADTIQRVAEERLASDTTKPPGD